MQVRIDTQNFELNEKQEHALRKKMQKLGRLCKRFGSGLVDLHLHLSRKRPPEGFVTKVNLSVPNKQMASETKNKVFNLSIGAAFKKVMAQLRNYRGHLQKAKSFAEVAKERGKL